MTERPALTATDTQPDRFDPARGGTASSRRFRLVSGATVVLTAAAMVFAGAGPAAAVDATDGSSSSAAVPTTIPTGIPSAGAGSSSASSSSGTIKAQSVGRFLDGVVGGMPLESLVDIKDARATAPGTTSAQNPFDVDLFNQADIPLTNAISIPSAPAVDAGAVNQVALANIDGSSTGASGAVANDGGINAGDAGDGDPSVASVNLSQDALGGATIPGLPGLPGAGSLPSIGGITASVGAVSAQAQTAVGGEVTPEPKYNIAGLDLQIASPALGQVLSTIGSSFDPSTLPVPGANGIPALPLGLSLPSECSFEAQTLSTISLEDGAVTISPTTGAITISITKLLDEFDIDINKLPANTDLLAYVLSYISNPKLLADDLEKALNTAIDTLSQPFTDCLDAIDAGPLAGLVDQLETSIRAGRTQIEDALDTSVITPLTDATSGDNPLSPLSDALKNLVDIGVNVESGPGIQAVQGNDALKYTTGLAATPNQATDVIEGQTLVRALEIDLLNVDTSAFGGLPGAGSTTPSSGSSSTPASGSSSASASVPISPPVSAPISIPGVPFANGVQQAATAPNAMGVSLAFGTAAVGPAEDATTSTTTPSTARSAGVASTAIPNAVPAGEAGSNGSPVLPFVLFLLGLTVLGGGLVAYRKRGRFTV